MVNEKEQEVKTNKATITFANTLAEIKFNPAGKVVGAGITIQNNDDLFFRAKQKEIVDQYEAARLLLRETEKNMTDHWFETTKDVIDDEEMGTYLKSIFYECALQYYNIVVDMSWVLVYGCIEYVYYKTDKDISPLKGIQDIKSARKSLQLVEENTCPPENNTVWDYLKNTCPEFTEVIDITISFWNYHKNSIVRSRNNFIKHRGKPLYDELNVGKICSIFADNGKNIYQMASGITDVSERYSLDNAIIDLVEFDDNHLYPYVASIIHKLEYIIEPSVGV